MSTLFFNVNIFAIKNWAFIGAKGRYRGDANKQPNPPDKKEHKLLCVANNGFIHDQSEDRKGFGYAVELAKYFNSLKNDNP